MDNIVLAVDFNNVVFTSYYSKPLINSKGENVNAIKGFFYKLKTYIDMFNPKYIVFANDLGRDKTFRRKLYKSYKGKRKEQDLDIINQMEKISRLLSLLGYPIINNEMYEADDILGMISRLANDNGLETVIVSSDKDLYQLIDDKVYILNPKDNEIRDLYYLADNYRLSPKQWIELKMLQGDPSDNIPGIPGIGHISALKLLQEYDTIDGIYKNLNQLKPKMSETLNEHKDKLDLLRTLVTIIIDYNILDLNIDNLKIKESYISEVYLLLSELEIPTLVNLFKYELILYIDKMKG